VTIPEPVVTIRMPEPGVEVDTTEPVVNVTMPEPEIRFVRPEPRITVEQAEPNVSVDGADANVDINEADTAQVELEQADADVSIEQSGEANIDVSQADPEVTVDNADEANVEVEQSDAEVTVSNEGGMDQSVADLTPAGLVGLTVMTDGEEDVGEIERVVITDDDRLAVIVNAGDFLDREDYRVAIMAERLRVDGEMVFISDLDREELSNMPEFNGDAEDLTGDVRLGDQS